MSILDDDLVGLNATTIRDKPLVADLAQSQRIADASSGTSISIAGIRHSQGGHTSFCDGRILLTTGAFNRIKPPTSVTGAQHDALIEVEAGATWEEIHRILGPYGFAPMVQQSSGHFSVGGSLSVNCHSRDPRWGPMSSTVEELTVLPGIGGEPLTASRTKNPDLFNAAIGGYGACGQILSAKLRVTKNTLLEYVGGKVGHGIEAYARHVEKLVLIPDVDLHYAWLCCTEDGFYDEALIAGFRDIHNGTRSLRQDDFLALQWGPEEVLRAGWSAARKDDKIRQAVWAELRRRHQRHDNGGDWRRRESRIDWLRSSTSFTSHRGKTSSDILQEYFVPVDKVVPVIDALKDIFVRGRPEFDVLSTTLRLVRADDETVLSYCRGGPRVCIAVDAEVATLADEKGRMDLHPKAKETMRAAIDAALAHPGSSYYLPYFNITEPDTFRNVYTGHAKLQKAIDAYNPRRDGKHRYWNQFLDRYFT